jgi:hypothetical protein
MEDFRRFVTGLAEVFAIIGIVVATIAGGVIGNSMGSAARMYGGADHSGMYAFFGLVVGFLSSVLATSFLFTLSEIANNTRQSLDILRRTAPPLPDTPATEPIEEPGMTFDAHAESDRPFEQINRDISEAALDILRRARDAGYKVTMQADGRSILIASADMRTECRSNRQIVQFGKQRHLV